MKISVVIPAFNAAATLGETLASVHAQARRADEVVVVDDGSTDATAVIAGADALVRLVRQTNAGAPSAMNAGVAAASGDAIAFLDADDLWMPDKLALQEQTLASEPGLDGVFGWIEEFVSPQLDPAQAARFAPRPAQSGWVAGTLLVHRRAFEAVGPFYAGLRGTQFIDWMDRARALGIAWRMRPEVVLRRRLHPGSLGGRSAARDRDLVEVARRALERRRKP